eukprot:COSAG01_NODE_3787_length_5693_cov_17.714337_5_plen_79_part_00
MTDIPLRFCEISSSILILLVSALDLSAFWALPAGVRRDIVRDWKLAVAAKTAPRGRSQAALRAAAGTQKISSFFSTKR